MNVWIKSIDLDAVFTETFFSSTQHPVQSVLGPCAYGKLAKQHAARKPIRENLKNVKNGFQN